MPRTQKPGLRRHSKTGQFYRLYDGKEKYFGKDESEAYRRFHHFEAERQNLEWYGQQEGNLMTALAGPPVPPVKTLDETSLRQVLKIWQGIQKDAISQTEFNDITRAFGYFVQVVKNKPLVNLSKEDFASFRRWVTKQTVSRSGKWHNDQHKRVKKVFRIVKRDTSMTFPSDLLEWASSYEPMAYRPDKQNSVRLPVAEWKRLLTVADQWSRVKIPTDKETQSGVALIRCANEKRLEGLRFAAMLRVAVCCAFDNVDCRRLHVDHLHLEGKTPYIDFPRIKQIKTVGIAVDRKLPLLPSVVKALKIHLKASPSPDFVFRTKDDEQYSVMGFDNATSKIFNAAKVTGFSWKHLRNVAPSLRKVNELPEEMSDAILGHVIEGTSKFYEESVDESYLVRLVNVVGAAYFEGDKV